MKRQKTLVLGLLAGALLSACAGSVSPSMARASLDGRSGASVQGSVSFYEVPGGLRVEAQVTGLTPGEHGFHVHEQGDCSAPDASSAKGHFNPAGLAHGSHDAAAHHAGDLPNLLADAQGVARYVAEVHGIGLNGPHGIAGRSIVIHADADDYTSQPAGNSGKRIACGVIALR